MNFEKTIFENEIVFVINQKTIDDNLIKKIISNANSKKRIGLDMTFVQNINSNVLIRCLLENKIKLFNLQSEVLTYFSIIFKDGFLKSYVNFLDFKDNKRELVKRHFVVN